MSAAAVLTWIEDGQPRAARWRSEAGLPPPKRVVPADDRMRADRAFALASQGTALLWRGDYQNARQMLVALARRCDAAAARTGTPAAPLAAADFHRLRMARAQRARILGMLLVPFERGHVIALRRAPEVGVACEEVRGAAHESYVGSLRELLGIIGAHEWRRRGIEVAALGATVHPHYGVFAPVRGEYVDLVARAPLPGGDLAFDIGTGTGVLAAVLARRGVARVVATDNDARALACARENLARLGLAARVEVREADLFPDGRAALIVCNPPWLPGRAGTPLERAVYDPDSRMLRGFVGALAQRLLPGGEGWLILSDLAERIGLRAPEDLQAMFAAGGLAVVGRLDARARHPKARDASDPLAAARKHEVTTLWRLAPLGAAP
ncbi:MAG: class I SAM-dependent methyltransferase [Burkholderiales bacterium]|nr:class I SAM-dependent methyltransferase [Burkholderiales bacterium]